MFTVKTLIVSLLLVAHFTVASAKDCPSEFFGIPLSTEGRVCHIFAPDLPASMSYFIAKQPQVVKAFYLEQYGKPDEILHVKGRFLLEYAKGQRMVIISADGEGSQVDILIKSS